MLSQKEICGLILTLCCFLAYSLPMQLCSECLRCLQQQAKELETAAKNFVDMPSHLNISTTTHQLPSCNSSLHRNDIVKAFHTLFQQLNETIDGASSIKSLARCLKQQKQCLLYWNVANSSINITYDKKDEASQKILLVKASERYNCLIQKAMNGNKT